MPITKYFINKNIDNQTETLYWHFQLNHISKPLRIRAQVSLYKGAQDKILNTYQIDLTGFRIPLSIIQLMLKARYALLLCFTLPRETPSRLRAL